jgi:endonuclease/exonuclease/phosphatase family metal-dependent hydrolase
MSRNKIFAVIVTALVTTSRLLIAQTTTDFLRKSEDALRIMTYNVNAESIFPDSDLIKNWPYRPERFQRILKATQPDVICLQEVYPTRSKEKIKAYFDTIIPLNNGHGWFVAQAATTDNVIVTRFPIKQLPSNLIIQERQVNALIDLPDELFQKDICIISGHFKSRGTPTDIKLRQEQADNIIGWIKDARTEGGLVDIPLNTPIIITGDFNTYESDGMPHLKTLLTGDISDEARFGTDSQPDWDNTELKDLLPSHNAMGIDYFTFYKGSFTSLLDRILFTDSVIQSINSFALNTTKLPSDYLMQFGLKQEDIFYDTEDTFDHLPIFGDFKIK